MLEPDSKGPEKPTEKLGMRISVAKNPPNLSSTLVIVLKMVMKISQTKNTINLQGKTTYYKIYLSSNNFLVCFTFKFTSLFYALNPPFIFPPIKGIMKVQIIRRNPSQRHPIQIRLSLDNNTSESNCNVHFFVQQLQTIIKQIYRLAQLSKERLANIMQ